MMSNIKEKGPKNSLVMLHNVFVEPYLRCCNSVRGQCGKTLTDKLQRQQNKAARITSGTNFEKTNHDDFKRQLNGPY